MHIRIGTRASDLALIQTEICIKRLKEKLDFTYEVVKIVTSGDKILDKPLYDIGGKALFIKEIEEALIDGAIDCAVHSLKDLPGILPNGLSIGAVLERENPFDVLVSKKASTILDMPYGSVIATSSPRRIAEILHRRKDIKIIDLRGNVQTRLNKWIELSIDGIILAAAGLKRLNIFNNDFCHILSADEMLPAAGQGVICVEILSNSKKMQELCNLINHVDTWQCSLAERGFLEYLDAGCRRPIGAFATKVNGVINAQYMLSGDNMEYYFTLSQTTDEHLAYNCGISAAKKLQIAVENHINT